MRTLVFAVILSACLNGQFAVATDNTDFISIAVDNQSVTYRSGDHLMIERMHEDRWHCSYRSADDGFPIGLLDGDEVFYLKMDHQSMDTAFEIEGSRLFLDGLPIRLEDVGSSELLLFESEPSHSTGFNSHRGR